MHDDDTPTFGGDGDETAPGFFDDATAAEDGAGAAPGPGAEASASGLSYSPGDSIGRYTIRLTLGEGGMGAVYLAEQSRPVKRTVALKVIKPGMDSASVVARFEAERQALAVMDHPCIARVYDGGTTERGLPYFVMEHVKGLPIVEHCDRHKLDMQARLRLFVRVCEAVQHAHGKGVIHRDLKPANVLVSYQGDDHTPKVIDFGIAKALGGKLTEATMHTELGDFVGTPEYMSPEQAGSANEDVDTRADVYALGVILYELLTGARPFDAETLKKGALFEVQRIIREVDPPRPSKRLDGLLTVGTGTTIAENRRTEIRSLSVALKRDLDWVVMKCLEKDRARRYDTANALAMEIERYLGDEPVLAGPPSASYRLSKFVKRNRAGVIAAGVGVVLVLAGLAGTSVGLVEAQRQAGLAQEAADAEAEQRGLADERADEAEAAQLRAEAQTAVAEAQLARSEEFKGFMIELLGSIEPDREFPERSLAIRELIDTAYDKLLNGDVGDATARAEIIDLLDATANRHRWYDLRIDLAWYKLNEASRLYGRQDPRTSSAAISLVRALLPVERVNEANRVLFDYFPDTSPMSVSGDISAEDLDLIDVLADLYRLWGNYEVALDLNRRALEIATELGDPTQSYASQIMISRMLWRLGRLEEALEASDAAKPGFIALTSPGQAEGSREPSRLRFGINTKLEDIDAWLSDSWVAYRADLMMDLGRYDEALGLYLEAEEIRAAISVDDFTRHVWAAGAGLAMQRLGRTAEAVEKITRAREGMLLTRAPGSMVREVSRNLLPMLSELGRTDERDRELADLRTPPSSPLRVYHDGMVMPYQPSGVMGRADKARWTQFSTVSPFEGEHCFEWWVQPGASWVAVGWMDPPNNWGDRPGGYDLTGASRLSFAARGEAGGESVVVGIGLIDTGDYQDTLRERLRIQLSTEWQRFEIPLDGLDLSTVRTGFVIESALSEKPQTIYFDDIRYE
jgi:serine/threonine protein kinase/tetratricopeptide (TPR) repeat protein